MSRPAQRADAWRLLLVNSLLGTVGRCEIDPYREASEVRGLLGTWAPPEYYLRCDDFPSEARTVSTHGLAFTWMKRVKTMSLHTDSAHN